MCTSPAAPHTLLHVALQQEHTAARPQVPNPAYAGQITAKRRWRWEGGCFAPNRTGHNKRREMNPWLRHTTQSTQHGMARTVQHTAHSIQHRQRGHTWCRPTTRRRGSRWRTPPQHAPPALPGTPGPLHPRGATSGQTWNQRVLWTGVGDTKGRRCAVVWCGVTMQRCQSRCPRKRKFGRAAHLV